MSKRSSKKAARSPKTADPAQRLRQTLAGRTKDKLIDVLVEMAGEDRAVLRRLAARFELQMPPTQLLAATRQAIADATAFDERDINRNFSYDDEAYREVQRNLHGLIELGQLRPAMELSLELMHRGSYQVEMSDEGLMTDDIQACLKVVLEALRKCDLPAAEVAAWCTRDAQTRPRGIPVRPGASGAATTIQGVTVTIIRVYRLAGRTSLIAACWDQRAVRYWFPDGHQTRRPECSSPASIFATRAAAHNRPCQPLVPCHRESLK